jgi:hypothetical protein
MLSLALDKLDESPMQPGASKVVNDGENKKVGHVDDDVESDVMGGGGGGTSCVDNMDTLDIPREEFSSLGVRQSSIKPNVDKRVAAVKMRLVRTEDVELVRELSSDIVNTVTRIIAARNQTALTKAEIVYLMSTMREAIEKFVPKENREAFVRFMMEKIPIGKVEEGSEDV